MFIVHFRVSPGFGGDPYRNGLMDIGTGGLKFIGNKALRGVARGNERVFVIALLGGRLIG